MARILEIEAVNVGMKNNETMKTARNMDSTNI
jgi:hypothetical protein